MSEVSEQACTAKKTLIQDQLVQYSTSANSSTETLCNTTTTSSSSDTTSNFWDNVGFFNNEEKTKLKEMKHFLSLSTSSAIHPVYRNILNYTKTLVLKLEIDRELNAVFGSENFVKLLAALNGCLIKLDDGDVSSLSLGHRNRVKVYEKIKKLMKFRKATNETYSLHLLTWLNTKNFNDFSLTYGANSGFHYCVPFHNWKNEHANVLH